MSQSGCIEGIEKINALTATPEAQALWEKEIQLRDFCDYVVCVLTETNLSDPDLLDPVFEEKVRVDRQMILDATKFTTLHFARVQWLHKYIENNPR